MIQVLSSAWPLQEASNLGRPVAGRGLTRRRRIRSWAVQRPGFAAFVVTQFAAALSQAAGDPPLFMIVRTATKRPTETMARRTRPRISILWCRIDPAGTLGHPSNE